MPPILAILSSLVGFYSIDKLKKTIWVVFPYYLFFQGVLDCLGRYFNGSYNLLYYAFVVYPYLYLFYIWIFKKSATKSQYKKIYNVAFILFFVSYIFLGNVYFDEIIGILKSGNTNSIDSSAISFDIYFANNTIVILFIVIITYFYELISSSKILYFYQDLQFWVCLGLIIFELFTFPYSTFKFFLFKNSPYLGMVMFYIEKTLCVLMYVSFITGFICMKKQ